MTERVKRIPGADHPIDIVPCSGRVVVRVGDRGIADSHDALTLCEADYPPVQYIPRKDVDMAVLAPSAHRSYCPYKRSEEHTSELQSLMRISYAVFCLKKKNTHN